MRLTWSDKGLFALTFADLPECLTGLDRYLERHGLTADEIDQADSADNPYISALSRYFDGEEGTLEDIPVVLLGTPFQLEVWDGLRRIPLGATSSYAELAASIGHPGAYRAVGTANGLNPIAIVIPCHRVIGADGGLAGYGGGIDNKRWLLEHEGVRRPKPQGELWQGALVG